MIVNKKIDQSILKLMKWSEKPQWLDFLNQVYLSHLDFPLDGLQIVEDELLDHLDPIDRDSINSAIIEDFFTSYFGAKGELNVINDYLKRRGSREPPVARQYFKALLDSWVSLYEVVELGPKGQTMKVQDLLQNEISWTIQNSSELDKWVIWDCIGARVVSMNGKHYFTSGALHFSRSLAKEIVESIQGITRDIERKIDKRARMTHKGPAELPTISQEVLCAAAPITLMLSHIWLTDVVTKAEMPLPEFHNTDNENIVICSVQFPIQGDPNEVIAKLDEMEEFIRLEDDIAWEWVELRESANRASRHREGYPDSKKISELNESEFEKIMLGFVNIGSKFLVLSVNSAERADRGNLLLKSCLGNLVGQSLTSYQDLEQAMNELPDSTKSDNLIENEQIPAFQATYKKEYYHRVLDEPVPMLGNKTPRKAATTEKGRSEVVEWLKELENLEHRHSQFDGVEPFDMTWIWKELKIDVPR